MLYGCLFILPSEYGGDIGLKGFLISQKLFLSTSEYHHYYQARGKVEKMPEFLKSPYNSLSKVYRFILSCRFVFLVLNLIFPPSRFSLLSSGRSHCYLPHFAPTASREKTSSQKYSLERNVKHSEWIEDYAGKFHQEANGSKLSKR